MKKEQILGILRHSLTTLGGILVTKGYIDEAVVTEITGAVMTLIGVIWSVLSKNDKN